MLKKFLYLILLTAIALSAGCLGDLLAGGGTDTETAWIAGMVTRNGSPVYGADVTIDGDSDLSAITSSSGKFKIYNVEYGSHNIEVSYEVSINEKYRYNGSFTLEGESKDLGSLPLTKINIPAKR